MRLVLGIGGGSDAILAFAIAQKLGAAYGNTKHSLDADAIAISPHVARFADDAPIRGTTKIDRRLPRGPAGSPLIVAEGVTKDELAFEQIIAVDTGGDSLVEKPGRDRRMLELGVASYLVVVAPGSDGQTSPEALLSAARRHRWIGAFSLAPLLPAIREHAKTIGAERTPNIILRAFDDTTDPVEVPRGKRPRIPRAWLTCAWVFAS